VQHEQRKPADAATAPLGVALLMMRCRPGTVRSYGRARLEAFGGPGSAAHHFAPPRAEITKRWCVRSRCAASGTRPRYLNAYRSAQDWRMAW